MIESAFTERQAKPRVVARWERLTREAADANVATTQLVYEMLIQIRWIKLILAWVLVVLPTMAAALIIVLNVLADEAAPVPGNPYGF